MPTVNQKPFASRLRRYAGTVTVSTIRLLPTGGGQHSESVINLDIEANHQQVQRVGAAGDSAEITLTRDVFIFDRGVSNILIDDIIRFNSIDYVVLNTILEGITNIQLSVETEAQPI